MKIGIYKDTLANRRGADAAVEALCAELRKCGHEAELFEKEAFAVKIKEQWEVMIATGTNELLDLSVAFPERFPWPVIMQFHTNPRQQFKRKRIIRNWRIRRALRRVHAIQVLREEFVPQVAKYGTKVAVIGNWSRYEGEEPATCAEKLIIYPAAFGGKKNHALLIEAFTIAHKHYPDWSLELYGEGNVPEHLPEGVKVMGYCDLAAAYRRCAFMAFPSLSEGFSLALLEASMFGKPSVLLEDWIGTAKAGGALQAKNTVGSFSSALLELMANVELRIKMGMAARNWCQNQYSRNRIMELWIKLIKETVDGCR